MTTKTQFLFATAGLLFVSCSAGDPEAAGDRASIQADLVASDDAWGNTEGPAVDSSGALYFTSRGEYKGIIRWTPEEGPQRHASMAPTAGPGGLWVDERDYIFFTATDERQVQMLAPDGTVTTLAEEFETNPALAKGPNDITVSRSGVVYFTDPKGYDGMSEPGTVYRIDLEGQVSIFDDSVVGPNGIVLSPDDRVLYVSNNVAETTSQLVRWHLAEDGSALGPKEVVAEISPCVADGMAANVDGHIWLTCYSFGVAHLIDPSTGASIERVSTKQLALTNAVFGRGEDRNTLYLTSSDMERITGYVYRATVTTPGTR